jgi:hypothetical protein
MSKKIVSISYINKSAEFIEVERSQSGIFTVSPSFFSRQPSTNGRPFQRSRNVISIPSSPVQSREKDPAPRSAPGPNTSVM